MKLGSLFDGIGGFPLAGTRHGIEPVWASEIEPFPIKVTSVRFPAMKHLGDITKIDGSAIEPVDIITFGSPCQDLSVAGKRAGLQHTDKGDETTTRSGLFMEAVRIIKQMREATRDGMGTAKPRWAVWENVPGAYSSNGGEDFRVVLEELARVADDGAAIPRPVKDKWTGNGCVMGDCWSLAWRTMDAQYWGVPQRRRRIYLVCDFAGGCAPKVLFEREGLRGNPAESGEAREGIAADASGCAGGPVWNESGKGYWMPGFGCLRAEGENRPSRPGHVIGAGGRVGDAQGRAGETVAFGVGESPDVAHCLRAGASKADKHESTTYVCIPINDHSVTGDVACTFTAMSGSVAGHSGPSVAVGFDGDIARTLTARHDSSPCADLGQNVVAISGGFRCGNRQQAHSVGFEVERAPTLPAEAGGNKACAVTSLVNRGHYREDGRSETLRAGCHGDTPLVMADGFRMTAFGEYAHDETASTVKARDYKDATDLAVYPSMRVRRLTPLECERLQGFPDGWTDIPGASDSGRYKALGNSLAIPTAEYVIEGISE